MSSWIDRIKNGILIRTGDGKEYSPSYLNATKQVEYNVADFEFANVSGTLVKRRTPKGNRYALELFFQGDNHLDISDAFDTSARDTRPWLITHPKYGRIQVQPSALNFDNSRENVTKITGTVVETIGGSFPTAQVNIEDKIKLQSITAKQTLATNYANNVQPSVADLDNMAVDVAQAESAGKKIYLQDVAADYFNAIANAQSAINNLSNAANNYVSNVEAQLATVQAALNAPAELAVSVQTRLTYFKSQLNYLARNIANTVLDTEKNYYQLFAGTFLTGMAYATSIPISTDYALRNDVYSTIDDVLTYYNAYIANISTLQSPTGGQPNSYIPDAASLQALDELINLTLANLFSVANNGKQQRSIILEADSNWIILAHRFYGLDANDSNITNLISQNGAGLNELLRVEKGRTVVYYV
jgi:hypothetical protein